MHDAHQQPGQPRIAAQPDKVDRQTLLPKSGPVALKGYITGFFYLAAWGPLFVILHMILMFKGASDVAAAGAGTGLSLATFAGMTDVNRDIGLLAGYLVASVPFLAGGVAKGALAISGQATSYLNPSQNAAEEAAREASTDNSRRCPSLNL